MNGKQVIKILQKNGWVILRVNGSHYRLGNFNKRVTVPLHGSRDLAKGLLHAIQKQSGVKLL